MERKKDRFAWRAGREGGSENQGGERVPSLRNGKKLNVWSESTLLLHVSAVGQQLLGSSVAPNRFSVSDTRLRRMITLAKLIQACFMLIRIHAQHWHFSRPPLSGHLIPTCHNLFSSILPVNPPPQPPFIYFFLLIPPLSCSVTPTPSLHPLMRRRVTTHQLWVSGCQQPLSSLSELIWAT